MAQALSLDLRERVVAAVDGGLSRRKAAAQFHVGVSSVVRWCQRVRSGGGLAPYRQGGDRRSQRIEAFADILLAAVKQEPDATLAELQTLLFETTGAWFGTGTLWRFFERHEITFKKSRRMRLNKSARML